MSSGGSFRTKSTLPEGKPPSAVPAFAKGANCYDHIPIVQAMRDVEMFVFEGHPKYRASGIRGA